MSDNTRRKVIGGHFSTTHPSEVVGDYILPASTGTELVQAIAALPQDDAVREQVVHDLRRAVDDYDFAVGQAGNLGGVELL